MSSDNTKLLANATSKPEPSDPAPQAGDDGRATGAPSEGQKTFLEPSRLTDYIDPATLQDIQDSLASVAGVKAT
ncbi:MAG TPA: hypothetical protein VKJ65_00380, partial [Phycisphaerae bacterium]|nr:hypothetical protein [Phycisphaerae bacterium]